MDSGGLNNRFLISLQYHHLSLATKCNHQTVSPKLFCQITNHYKICFRKSLSCICSYYFTLPDECHIQCHIDHIRKCLANTTEQRVPVEFLVTHILQQGKLRSYGVWRPKKLPSRLLVCGCLHQELIASGYKLPL